MENVEKISYILKLKGFKKDEFKEEVDSRYSFFQKSLSESITTYRLKEKIDEILDLVVYQMFDNDKYCYINITIAPQNSSKDTIDTILDRLKNKSIIERIRVSDTKHGNTFEKNGDLDDNDRSYLVHYFVKGTDIDYKAVKTLLGSGCEDLSKVEKSIGCSKLYSYNYNNCFYGKKSFSDNQISNYNLIATIALSYNDAIGKYFNLLTTESKKIDKNNTKKMQTLIDMKFEVSQFDSTYLFKNPIKPNRIVMRSIFTIMENSMSIQSTYEEFINTFNGLSGILSDISTQKRAQKETMIGWVLGIIATLLAGLAVPGVLN